MLCSHPRNWEAIFLFRGLSGKHIQFGRNILLSGYAIRPKIMRIPDGAKPTQSNTLHLLNSDICTLRARIVTLTHHCSYIYSKSTLQFNYSRPIIQISTFNVSNIT
ncbi:hypothetical protein VNO77_24253 [Canavalia gladiata]|uniref:Uncharacterized protein n=1 Tax=Canavalia gladiata TaxID=3824 RepID=A0AAN9LB96_CANGL